MKITAVQIDPPKLHKTIVTYFGLDELRDLCFELTLDFDELPPGGKSAKARGLVEICQRQRRLVQLAEAVLAQRPNLTGPEFLRDIADDDAPFKGLLAFEEADEEIFFGREALTDELVARVFQPPGGSNLREVLSPPTNFLAIVGASGSGKSSVVRAGMIPQLRRQTKWPIHLITPTVHPLQALATSLTRDSESVTATATLMDDLQKEPRALRLVAARLLQDSQAQRLLLVVDQFEELFTLCKDEAERKAFVENLVDAVANDGQITILLTLRADFYHHCLQFEPLHHLLEQQQKIVTQMGSAELQAAIELPAQQANLTFEGGLVDILLRDVGAADNQTPEPGALPLLSHALLETWQRRDPAENRLTLAGYTEAGGVQGAIAKTAESTYQRLPADQQKIARSIFLRLTELGEGTQDTRRRAALAELLPQNEERAKVEQVLKTLADARLLTTSNDGAEVAHEALIRQWPTLQSWLGEDREGLRLHRQLTEAALAWETNNRDGSYLYRGGRLTQTRDWVETDGTPLNQQETEFLQASRQQQRDELAEANARAEREADAAQKLRQRAIFLRGALILAATLAVVALLLYGNASSNENEANRQRRIALAQSVAALSSVVVEQQDLDTELATLLAIEGVKLNADGGGNIEWLLDDALRTRLTANFFNNTLRGHESIVLSVAFSPDGGTLASGSADQTIRLWDLRNPAAEPTVLWGHEASVLSVAFSPDGRTLASGGDDQTIRLWDIADPGAEPVVLRGHEGVVWSVAFLPDGHTLASGSHDQTIRLWDISDPATDPMVLWGHESLVLSVAFSPDGRTLASGSFPEIRLWDMGDGTEGAMAEPTVLQGHENSVLSVAFSPDGRTLASGSADQTIRLWDMSDPAAEPTVLRGHEASVLSVAFSPDGEMLASGSDDQMIRLWVFLEELVEIGCQKVWRNFNWEEWQRYLSGEPYRQTCPNLPPHPSVPVEELQ